MLITVDFFYRFRLFLFQTCVSIFHFVLCCIESNRNLKSCDWKYVSALVWKFMPIIFEIVHDYWIRSITFFTVKIEDKYRHDELDYFFSIVNEDRKLQFLQPYRVRIIKRNTFCGNFPSFFQWMTQWDAHADLFLPLRHFDRVQCMYGNPHTKSIDDSGEESSFVCCSMYYMFFIFISSTIAAYCK